MENNNIAAENPDGKEDKLDTLFKMQAALDGYIREKRNLNFSRGEWVCKKAQALTVELSEVLEEAQYKWWKNYGEIDDAKLKEEIVDVLHFFLGMCIDSGMTSDRQNGLSSKKGYEAP